MLLMDRGFSTGAVAWLNASGSRWLMPCRNTPRVKAALRGFANGIRLRVSTFWFTDVLGRQVVYTMNIEKKRGAGEEKPEGEVRRVRRERAGHKGGEALQEEMGHRDRVRDGKARHNGDAPEV